MSKHCCTTDNIDTWLMIVGAVFLIAGVTYAAHALTTACLTKNCASGRNAQIVRASEGFACACVEELSR